MPKRKICEVKKAEILRLLSQGESIVDVCRQYPEFAKRTIQRWSKSIEMENPIDEPETSSLEYEFLKCDFNVAERRKFVWDLYVLRASKSEIRAQVVEKFKVENYSRKNLYDDIEYGHNLYHQEMAETIQGATDLEIGNINHAQVKLWPAISRGDVRSIMAFVQLSNQRCKILGLYHENRTLLEASRREDIDTMLDLIKDVFGQEGYEKFSKRLDNP